MYKIISLVFAYLFPFEPRYIILETIDILKLSFFQRLIFKGVDRFCKNNVAMTKLLCFSNDRQLYVRVMFCSFFFQSYFDGVQLLNEMLFTSKICELEATGANVVQNNVLIIAEHCKSEMRHVFSSSSPLECLYTAGLPTSSITLEKHFHS